MLRGRPPFTVSRRTWTYFWIICLVAISFYAGMIFARWQQLLRGASAEEAGLASAAEVVSLPPPPPEAAADPSWKRECLMDRCGEDPLCWDRPLLLLHRQFSSSTALVHSPLVGLLLMLAQSSSAAAPFSRFTGVMYCLLTGRCVRPALLALSHSRVTLPALLQRID